MYIKQKELFEGLSKGFIKEIVDLTEKKTYLAGDVVFREGVDYLADLRGI